MKAHQAEFPIVTMCRVLEVSTSGYYGWLRRHPSKRDQDDAMLTQKIRAIHRWSRGTYGAPRIHAELQEEGLLVGCKRVARLMQADGLQGVSRRKATTTTIRSTRDRPAPDLVERDFTADAPNGLWVADITYIATAVVSISPLCLMPSAAVSSDGRWPRIFVRSWCWRLWRGL